MTINIPAIAASLLTKIITIMGIIIIIQPAQATNHARQIFENLTQSQGWTWQTLAQLPKSPDDSGLTKDVNQADRYYLERTLSAYSNGSITGYGSRSAPDEVVFHSGGWGTTDTKGLLKLTDIINPNALTLLKSNCNFGKIEDNYSGKDEQGNRFQGTNYVDYQKIYQWSRPAAKPLYVVALQGGGYLETSVMNQGFTSSVIVVPKLSQINTAIMLHGWHRNQNGKLITCQVE